MKERGKEKRGKREERKKSQQALNEKRKKTRIKQNSVWDKE